MTATIETGKFTVEEVIAFLSQFDGDLPVIVDSANFMYDNLWLSEVEVYKVDTSNNDFKGDFYEKYDGEAAIKGKSFSNPKTAIYIGGV